MASEALLHHDRLHEDDSKVWLLSLLASLLLYFLLVHWGARVWEEWRRLDASTAVVRQTIKVSSTSQEVIQKIQEIEVRRKEREAEAQKQQEIVQIKDVQFKGKADGAQITKNTPDKVEKNKAVKKNISNRSQAENFNIPLSDLLARSKSATKKSAAGVAQSATPSRAFNLSSIDVTEKTQVQSKILVADRLSGSTYEGGLVEHTNGPKGLIYKPTKDEMSISEGLPLELIQMVVEENEIQLRYCYEIQLLKSPNLEGAVNSAWKINAEGAVESVQLSSAIFDSTGLFSCLENKMKAWKFPKPKGGVSVLVNYPMRFSKQEVL